MAKRSNRRIFQIIFILSLLLNLFTAVYFVRKLSLKGQASAYIPPPKPAYYLDRDKLFDVLPKDSNSIIFLGNSLTQYFELAELFANNHVKNRGIHGDDLDGTLKRLTPIVQAQPKKIFIELGINDLALGHTKERLLKNYERLIDTLQKSCGQTKIYVQSILPTENSSLFTPTYCSPEKNKEIVAVNVDLRQLSTAKGCTFIDAHRQFVLNGQLNSRYSVDGLHLSGEGYLLWTKILKPYVND